MDTSERKAWFEDLRGRGLLEQTSSPDLPALLTEQDVTFYVGYDPTADSLHVGNLLPLMTQVRMARAGHRAIVVIGGATGMIGDPQRQEPGAPAAGRRDAGAQHGRPTRADGARVRQRGRRRAADGQQQRLVPRRRLHRIPARHRQALQRQRHDRQGLGAQPPGGARTGDLLHRVQLPAPAGVRLPAPVQRRGLQAPDRRHRPVGQHHRRDRPHPGASAVPRPTASATRSSPTRRARSSARASRATCGSMPRAPARTRCTSSS